MFENFFIGNFLLGFAVGGVVGALLWSRLRGGSELAVLQERLTQKETQLEEVRSEGQALQIENKKLLQEQADLVARMESDQKHFNEKIQILSEMEKRFTDSFKALSSDALQTNNQAFLELARENLAQFQNESKGDLEKRQVAIEQMVKPVSESLDKVQGRLQELETARTGAYESLRENLKSLLATQKDLKSETGNLVKALRSPTVRGRWGEIQLKRVVEMAGMLDHCDFYEQTSVEGEEGRLRPDLVVKLPGGKNIVVDAKAPLAAYLEAIEFEQQGDELKGREQIQAHARQIRTHMNQLSKKSYWDQFQPSPEFVVLFLPGEMFFSAALQEDPSLIESGVNQRVIIATPTTLIALLRSVAYGWRQEKVNENAKQIAELGREMHKRVSDMSKHVSRLGKNLSEAVGSYNKTVGTLESRVLVSARKFQELEAAQSDVKIEQPGAVEKLPRDVSGLL